VITIVVVLSYMEWRDTKADWTVFVLAIGLLLVLEFLLQGDWLRRRNGRSGHRDGPPTGPRDGPHS
jgi:hypothetical protein